jgi:hypothetical protein
MCAAAVTKLSIAMVPNNSICQHSSAFSVDSGFHLLFEHGTVPCTINHLSTILVALTHSTLFAVHEVVGWPKLSSVMLILPLWNLSTNWYSPLPQKLNDSVLLNNGAI